MHPPADVLDAFPDGLVVADAHGVVTHANARACRMLGVDGPGSPLAETLLLQDRQGRDWCSAVRPYDGLPSRSGIPEQSWLLPDGAEVLVAAGLQRDPVDRRVLRVAVSLRSARGRTRLDRERSDLVATVAHELRSPLTGVRAFVQALLTRWDRLSDDQKLLMLATVNADAERLSRLIIDLLDVARIDTGRLVLHTRPSDVQVLTERVITSISATTSREIGLQVHGELPKVNLDPDKFTQVATNLVENAVRHGDGRVGVGLSRTATSVLLTVTDEGDGIAEEIRRRVFTKFWTRGPGGSSGLGMYIVQGLVRGHGGTVEITDADGGGAQVTVAWPVHDDGHVAPLPETPSPGSGAGS
ncbi:PAS domain-containing sensor histidine kinase [Nocardioides limicola]|uniref:PAS domain-containing sensor histidine kinase n=1 Tax=Nocardioides limicola TaxID=2803368 RepID=UPI0027DE6301|nr:PAS domain-containing sensor histidine kinase [Nocardioides sp. DJM-14]